jgi:hypothetical protein
MTARHPITLPAKAELGAAHAVIAAWIKNSPSLRSLRERLRSEPTIQPKEPTS